MKSIEPRKKPLAPDYLENSFNRAVNGTPDSLNPEPPKTTAALKPKKEKNEISRPKAAAKTAAAPKRSGKTRVTLDLPEDLYQAMEQHKEATGQNFTFFISKLLKEHFSKNK